MQKHAKKKQSLQLPRASLLSHLGSRQNLWGDVSKVQAWHKQQKWKNNIYLLKGDSFITVSKQNLDTNGKTFINGNNSWNKCFRYMNTWKIHISSEEMLPNTPERSTYTMHPTPKILRILISGHYTLIWPYYTSSTYPPKNHCCHPRHQKKVG